jgi:hypothetical protein
MRSTLFLHNYNIVSMMKPPKDCQESSAHHFGLVSKAFWRALCLPNLSGYLCFDNVMALMLCSLQRILSLRWSRSTGIYGLIRKSLYWVLENFLFVTGSSKINFGLQDVHGASSGCVLRTICN